MICIVIIYFVCINVLHYHLFKIETRITTGKKRVESIFDLTIDYAIVACDLQLILT